ncbi:hypothetical protein BH23BAC2_BH23BAC2_07880 [soil metagenome]
MSSNIKISRICQLCGNEFTARTTVTQYCGDVCAKRAYKKKQKVQKIEQSNIETLALKAAPIKAIQEQDYLSIQETCGLLKISRMTLYRLIKNKKIPSAKFGRRTIYIQKKHRSNFYSRIMKVTVRQKKISKNRFSLYLDYYPPLVDPETKKSTRREFLGLYAFENPKTYYDKYHNKETKLQADLIRASRQLDIQRNKYDFIFKKPKQIDS